MADARRHALDRRGARWLHVDSLEGSGFVNH